ncbi:MAG: antibiotic biosynthesis monooxygenase [Caulobacterales bacterium]
MIVIAGHLRIAPEFVEDLAAALRSLAPATLKEDGCYNYHFALDDPAAGTILVYERWRDQAALAAHLALPSVGAVLGGFGDKISIEVRKFDALNERGFMD